MILQVFVKLGTATGGPENKLTLNQIYLVFDVFVKKAGLISIPPNFFPIQFTAVLETVYDRGFDMKLESRTTIISELSFSTRSLQDLCLHVMNNRKETKDENVLSQTNILYYIALRDLFIIANAPHPSQASRMQMMSVFFPKNRLPNYKQLTDTITNYQLKGDLKPLQQVLPNAAELAPIQNSFVNSSFLIDSKRYTTPTDAEVYKREVELSNRNQVFLESPAQTDVFKRLVIENQAKIKQTIIANSPDPESSEARLNAMNYLINNYEKIQTDTRLELESNSSLASQIAEDLRKEIVQEAEYSDIKETLPPLEPDTTIEELKSQLRFQIDHRIEVRGDITDPKILNAKNIYENSKDTEQIQRATRRLRQASTMIKNNLMKKAAKENKNSGSELKDQSLDDDSDSKSESSTNDSAEALVDDSAESLVDDSTKSLVDDLVDKVKREEEAELSKQDDKSSSKQDDKLLSKQDDKLSSKQAGKASSKQDNSLSSEQADALSSKQADDPLNEFTQEFKNQYYPLNIDNTGFYKEITETKVLDQILKYYSILRAFYNPSLKDAVGRAIKQGLSPESSKQSKDTGIQKAYNSLRQLLQKQPSK